MFLIFFFSLFFFLLLHFIIANKNTNTKMGLLDIVPAGVVTGDNVKKLFDYGMFMINASNKGLGF